MIDLMPGAEEARKFDIEAKAVRKLNDGNKALNALSKGD